MVLRPLEGPRDPSASVQIGPMVELTAEIHDARTAEEMYYQGEYDPERLEQPSDRLRLFDQYNRLDGLQEPYHDLLCGIVELLNAPSPCTSSWPDRPSCRLGRNCRRSPSIQQEAFHVFQQFVYHPPKALDHAHQIPFFVCDCDTVFGSRAEFHGHLFENDHRLVLMVSVRLFEGSREFSWL